MLTRLIALLVIVILGSIAAVELYKALITMLPLLIVLTMAVAIGGGWVKKKRRF